MEKSRNPGTPSSDNSNRVEHARSALSALGNRAPLSDIISILGNKTTYIVGGTVRDALIGEEPHDFDLATPLAPVAVQRKLIDKGVKVVETGIAHGTVLAVVDGHHIEITSFRVPSSREKHLSADSIETDLGGRDFTINAIAFSTSNSQFIDPFNGIADIFDNNLRTPFKAEDRFKEDPLRILRLIRFGPAANRWVDAECIAAARKLGSSLKEVSPERIRTELERILLADNPADAFHSMLQWGLMTHILPEVMPSVGFEQNEFHIHDVFEHTLWVINRTPKERTVRWAALFHDLGKPHTLSIGDDKRRHFYSHEVVSETLSKEIMQRLRFSNDDMQRIGTIVRLHMRPLNCGAPGVRRLLRDLGEYFDEWLTLKKADTTPTATPEHIEQEMKQFMSLLRAELERRKKPAYGKLAVDGNALIKLGLKPGPQLGKILKALEEIVLDDPECNTAEYLLEQARKMAAKP